MDRRHPAHVGAGGRVRLHWKTSPVAGTAPQAETLWRQPPPDDERRRVAAGRAYALRNCDAFFTATRFPALAAGRAGSRDVKAAGKALGKDTGVYTVGQVVCRPTRKEAQDYWRYWTEETADWGAAEYMLALKGRKREDDPEGYDRMRRALVHGQSGYDMIGTPDDVADDLARLSAAGFDGIGFSFLNYLRRTSLFRAGSSAAAAPAGIARK